MTKRAKAWSYGVAYLSLAIGAGVSVAGNIADTHRISAGQGRTPDSLDIFIAGFWPGAVLLVIEMFVSRLWPQRRGPQAIRWGASLIFGFIAAFMSWIHLSDLLASRAQGSTVATLGPLAIDGLAIMATALILANRGHRVATQDMAKPYVATAGDVRESEEAFASGVQDMASADIWSRLDRELDTDGPTLPVPVSPAPAGVDKVPAEARLLLAGWMSTPEAERPAPGDVDRLVASHLDKTPRTARRWRDALKG